MRGAAHRMQTSSTLVSTIRCNSPSPIGEVRHVSHGPVDYRTTFVRRHLRRGVSGGWRLRAGSARWRFALHLGAWPATCSIESRASPTPRQHKVPSCDRSHRLQRLSLSPGHSLPRDVAALRGNQSSTPIRTRQRPEALAVIPEPPEGAEPVAMTRGMVCRSSSRPGRPLCRASRATVGPCSAPPTC
jgi:hypothetical protein